MGVPNTVVMKLMKPSEGTAAVLLAVTYSYLRMLLYA